MPRINSRHFLLNELLEIYLKSDLNRLDFLNSIVLEILSALSAKFFIKINR